MEALNRLYDEGRISIEDYDAAMIGMKKTADEVSGTFAGGFRTAFADTILTVQELGAAFGEVVASGIDAATDAIVEFAKTGKLEIRSLFAELFAQLLKLAAQQLILAALGALTGGASGGPGASAGILGIISGLAGNTATGGSIMPSGSGSTDTQLVAFNKRPDERVDILTPAQQAAQSGANGNGQGNTTVVSSPPVNVAAVFSPADIVGAFDSDAGETVIVNMIQRNAGTVRQVLQG